MTLYKLGRGQYARLLLSASDLRQFGQAVRLVSALAEQDRQRIADHQRRLASLQAARAATAERQQQVQRAQADAQRAQAAAEKAIAAHSALVDEIGGLDAAIAYAAQKANLGSNYKVVEFPRPKELMEAVQEFLEKVKPGSASTSTIAKKIAQHVEGELKVLRSLNDPQGVYARLPVNLTIR